MKNIKKIIKKRAELSAALWIEACFENNEKPCTIDGSKTTWDELAWQEDSEDLTGSEKDKFWNFYSEILVKETAKLCEDEKFLNRLEKKFEYYNEDIGVRENMYRGLKAEYQNIYQSKPRDESKCLELAKKMQTLCLGTNHEGGWDGSVNVHKLNIEGPPWKMS